MYDYGLILEGGGMRGLYTTGVIDFFIDNDIEFKHVYGVSAGSVNGINYVSKQRKRNYYVNVNYINDKNYASIQSLLTTGDYFNKKMCYKDVPEKLMPFDYEAFKKYTGEFYAVATDCETGLAKYFKIEDGRKDMDKLRASCSLPLISNMVKIDGRLYLDGGLSDSIPVRKSVQDGNKKNVVILTRDLDYRKKPNNILPVLKVKYSAYPNLINAIKERHNVYNNTLEYIINQEKKGNLFCIRPSKEITIGRLEKDVSKLKELYEMGYEDAKNIYDDLLKFLES
ncbi:Predicted phospholipase, patatin/cPLA2 family [Lachnospiraceae bacterium RM5]|nr:Predicted phospholipase, patatin/cPLA2 family [Lachnospiraceae bacterium RM5]